MVRIVVVNEWVFLLIRLHLPTKSSSLQVAAPSVVIGGPELAALFKTSGA